MLICRYGVTRDDDFFSQIIDSEDACKTTVEATGANINQLTTVSDISLPTGCILQPSKKREGLKILESSVSSPVYNVKFNRWALSMKKQLDQKNG